MSAYLSVHELAALLPVGVVKDIGGKVRATHPDHCNSCHDDHDGGYAPIDESWIDDERYYNREKWDGKGIMATTSRLEDILPWSLRFCCCSQKVAFEEAIKAEIERRAIA